MEKAQIQFPRYFVNRPRHEAIISMETYVNEHLDEFIDGEEITIRYRAADGKIRSVNAIVDKPVSGEATVSVEIGEVDTLKIIESGGTEGLDDKDALWLSDNWDDEVSGNFPASDLKSTVRSMAAELRVVREELALCKEALTNTLGGGDVLLNSTKYELENQYEPERPDGAPYPYTTGDTEIYSWNVYIGPSVIDEQNLYEKQRYYPKVRAFNSAGEEIEITSSITVTMSCGSGSAGATYTGKTLYAVLSGDCNFYAVINDPGHGFTDAKTYLLLFESGEKPDYEKYNVKHLLVKHAESFDYMMQHSSYLLVGEFCWCIKEQALYLKEEAKNGTIQLFKINGGGSVTPTGETKETVTYIVTELGDLVAESSDDSINVDDNGILNLIGEVNADGILLLNDTETSGGSDDEPVTPTGGTITIIANVDRDGILTVNMPGVSNPVDRDGSLLLIGQVDRNGDMSINNM